VLATPNGQGDVAIAGDPAHPANFGRLCSKGFALNETLGSSSRLLHPMLRTADGTLARRTWSSAVDYVAEGIARVLANHGPNAIAFYLSGQLLTEDYYVANKLMKGFLGSANVDTNSRLCMASSVAGHRRAFGADTVPANYADLEEADLIVLVGSNAAWCHPVLFQRMQDNRRARGATIVVIDPRRTATAEDADLFLPVSLGMDTTLFSGLLVHLAQTGALDRHYIDEYTSGFADALARASAIAPDLARTAELTGLAEGDVAAFFSLFRQHKRVVTCFSQGVNQSAQGTDKVNAIINCHLATGRIGKPGMGPFSLTGQPNAMGGREVGGLANQLAAHMNFSPAEVDRVRRFWRAPRIAAREGLKAVQMFDAIERGEIKALWVMATNPAVSLPRSNAVRKALRKLELFVLSENVLSNDSVNAGAHVLLPALAWGEKDGTVTNSERRISRQRPFLAPAGEAKADWWIVSEVARRLGFADGFPYRSPAEIFREHAALSVFENHGTRDFDLSQLTNISDVAYDALAPLQWGSDRFFSRGSFYTSDRRARFIAPEKPALRAAAGGDFPFLLNTGRVRDQWHTMTRTGLSPRLCQHRREPFIEVHEVDACAAGLTDGGFARVNTPDGEGVFLVVVNKGQRPGSLFVPIHWSDMTSSNGGTNRLIAAHTDPISGQPELKATPARIAPLHYAYRGFALTREPLALPSDTWWARVAISGGLGTLIATHEGPQQWRARAHTLGSYIEFAEFMDSSRGVYRMAAFREGLLDLALFIGPAHSNPDWSALAAPFQSQALTQTQRQMLLSGRSSDGLALAGPLICACFGIGQQTIMQAIANGCASVDAIGRTLRAGTNCGSCLPELRKIVHGQVG
jgi:assimilatory nitrate reductase catalytic subunit